MPTHCMFVLIQGLAKICPTNQSQITAFCVNKIFLEPIHVCSFMYCQWQISHTTVELNPWNANHMTCKAWNIYYPTLYRIFSNVITWGKSHSNKNFSYSISWYALICILQNKLSPLNAIVKRLMKTLVWDWEESGKLKKKFCLSQTSIKLSHWCLINWILYFLF